MNLKHYQLDPEPERPNRSFSQQLWVCTRHGHDPGEWVPSTTGRNTVAGRKRYCRRCGTLLDYDSFSKCPELSAVFAGESWYPEQLSCYDDRDDDSTTTCERCGKQFPDQSHHSEVRLTDLDLRDRHSANVRREIAFRGPLCPACSNALATWLDAERVEAREVVPA